MNEKRINTEEEQTLSTAKIAFPKMTICILLALVSLAITITTGLLLQNYSSGKVALIIIAEIIAFIILIVIIFKLLEFVEKKCSCVITNKRITGTTFSHFALKRFSYRLSCINSVEVYNCLGFHFVKFTYNEGEIFDHKRNRQKTYRIAYVENHIDFYNNLSKILTDTKNEIDCALNCIPLK